MLHPGGAASWRVDEKAALRAQARAARRAIPAPERERLSERIAEHALDLPELTKVGTIGCYVAAGSEVDTRLLLRGLTARAHRVAVPVIAGDALRWVRLNHPWALVPGERGIDVPRQPWEDAPASELVVVFVPGVRFGRDGSRLGQGGGHFDRFLVAHPKALRVGLAFDAQLDARVPTEEHDEGMDVIVTENGRLRIGRPAAQA